MIISRTPFRISFFGGGTDYPTWYKENGGSVLATTIDKYCYISTRYLPPFFDHKHRIVYSKVEAVNSISEIEHPSVRAVLSTLKANRGLEIHHDGDLPARSGLGSSSSFTVGLLNCLNALEGRISEKSILAKTAINIEQNIIGETVGSQDQISAAYGGFNRIDFNRDDSFGVTPIILNKERKEQLEKHLFLCFTGFSRFASDVAKKKIENFKERENELRSLKSYVDEGISILQSSQASFSEFGELLHSSWLKKRSLSEAVSSPQIDAIYEAGRRAGATGGKLLGAGGGGFMLFVVPPEKRNHLAQALECFVQVPFQFESEGSKIVLYDPNF